MMAMLWYSWLLVSMTMLFPSKVYTYPANLCTHPDSNSLRTWGPNCRRMCHCENDEPCDSRGYCANGCIHGWARLTPNGSCSVRISKNATPDNTLLSGSLYNNKNTKIRGERNTVSQLNIPMFRFSQDGTCIKDHTGVNTKFARITANPPILIKDFAVIFNVNPRTKDITKATFTIKNFENYSVTQDLKYSTPDKPNMLSVENLRYVLVDSVTIAVTSTDASKDCSPAVIDGFVLSGKPICSYGHWGLMCERTCACPCGWQECHPSSGRCLERGLVCPANKFGQQCSSTCSSGCYGYPPECHPLTGLCKECEQGNMTGVSCRSAITLEEEIQRHARCNSTGTQGINSSNSSAFDQVYQSALSQKNSYRLGIVIIVFLIVFLLVCFSYVVLVQHCARRRMKERLLSMEEARRRQSSLATYTEFKKEFMEMQGDKALGCCARSRSEEATTQQNLPNTPQNINAQHDLSTSQASPVDPKLLKAVADTVNRGTPSRL